jgi:hypothetical protein
MRWKPRPRRRRFREDLNAGATQTARMMLHETVTAEQVENWLVERGEPHEPADVAAFLHEMVGTEGPRLVAGQAALVQEAIKLALGPPAETLWVRRWRLVRSEELHFLTSDEPVCLSAPDDQPVGFGNAPVMWLPLSRNTLLEIAGPGHEDIVLPEGADLVAQINREVASQAQQWILHHPDDAPLDGIELNPRTAWGNQLIVAEIDGTVIRGQRMFRRLPPS